jgi:hypothetical protein
MTREDILEEAERHFFAAMLTGWAADVKGKPVPDMPGYKRIPPYKRDGFCIVDQYCVGEKCSAGTTTIWYKESWYEGSPIWFMSYGGYYNKEHVPFLKKMLLVAYMNDKFIGGRGPESFTAPLGHLLYRNYLNVNELNTFEKFSGREVLYNDFVEVGHHEYWGMALI